DLGSTAAFFFVGGLRAEISEADSVGKLTATDTTRAPMDATMKRSALALRLLRPRPRDRTESRYCRPLNPSKPADCGYPRQFGGRPVDVLGTMGPSAVRIGSPAHGPRLAAPHGPAAAGGGVPACGLLDRREPRGGAGRTPGGPARA